MEIPMGADTLTGAAIGASSRTVISPQEMKGHGIRGIDAFSHPLGRGFVHETGGTITQGAAVPAGVTPDAAADKPREKSLFLFGIHGLDFLHVRIGVDVRLFLHRIPQHFVVYDGIAMSTDRAPVALEKLCLFKSFLKILSFDHECGTVLHNIQNFLLLDRPAKRPCDRSCPRRGCPRCRVDPV